MRLIRPTLHAVGFSVARMVAVVLLVCMGAMVALLTEGQIAILREGPQCSSPAPVVR